MLTPLLRRWGGPGLLALAAGASLLALGPPRPRREGGGPDAFSVERALGHLREIAREPHPSGSARQEAIGAYLVETLGAAGFAPEVQVGAFGDLRIRNVAARLPGTASTGAVLLAAHSDAHPGAPGAGDDGIAVASLLEAARALRASPPLRNDLILLFTDGEEVYLLGARLFVGHPWFAGVSVVLNFEGRGCRGPLLMFETSRPNGWLVEAFAEAVAHPRASSLMGAVYERMPNDTDFSVFRRAGARGLNFAFIGGYEVYHSPRDRFENASERTVAHVGETALAAARRFGGADLAAAHARDLVYFDLPAIGLVTYPAAWVGPLTLLAFALFVGLFLLGSRRGRLRIRPLLRALGALASALVIPALGAGALGQAAVATVGRYQPFPWGRTDHDALFFAAIVLGTVGAALALFRRAERSADALHVTLAAALVTLLALGAVTLWLPGGSYVFLWLVLPFAIPIAVPFLSGSGAAPARLEAVLAAFAGVPGAVLLAPLVALFFQGMMLGTAAVVAPLPVLLLGLAWPALREAARFLVRAASFAALGFAIAGFLAGALA